MRFFSLLLSLSAVLPAFVSARPMFGEPGKIWAKGNKTDTSIAKRAGPGAAPHWVAYWDSWVNNENGPPSPSVLKGYNVLILAFLLASGPADQVTEWTSLSAATRSSIKSQYSAAGISLMVSAFGSTDAPTSSGYDPVATANTMANFVKTYSLDGIDVDYEDFNAINAHDGKAEQWLITFTQTLRNALPAGQYIITHAPVAPWFSPIYTAGAYRKVHSSVGNLIDWYNIQFYNQDEYTTCAGLLTTSSSTFPNTAVFQINTSAGVPLNKIVIGKPGISSDANNGYMAPATLAGCVATAKNQGWTGGAMVWEYPHADSAWITSVRAQSWPVSGSPPPPPPPTSTTKVATTTTKSTTTTPASGSCSGVAAWSSTTIYTLSQTSTYGGFLWTAKWWTQGDAPGTNPDPWSDPWTKGAAC